MMPDDTKTAAEKIRASLAANRLANGQTPRPAITSTPGPGFRFATGDKVIDLVTGARATVAAWYQSATNQGPVYELRVGGGAIVVRLEKEIERDGPQNVPAFLPRV